MLLPALRILNAEWGLNFGARRITISTWGVVPAILELAVEPEHFRLAVVLHGERVASRLMRKFGIRFAAHHPDGDSVRKAFIACSSVEDWHAVLAGHYPRLDHAAAGTAASCPTPSVKGT